MECLNSHCPRDQLSIQHLSSSPDGLHGVHGFNPIVQIAISVLSIPVLYLIHVDYKSFMSLGPGGTPQTPLGYLKLRFLSIFALSNPYEPPNVPRCCRPQKGVLTLEKSRKGPRPEVRGIAPHRQTTQKGGEKAYQQLCDAVSQFAREKNNQMKLGTSCFEKNSTGLFSTSPIALTCNGEICHAHPSDGSLHLTLHPADVAIVLEKGWGERHPLAKGGWLSRFVPNFFIMVYAPRDEEELEVVKEIICAAAWYVGGERPKEGEDVEEKIQRDGGSVHVKKFQRCESSRSINC